MLYYFTDKKEESDSFGEKLATNVIKNLQVCVYTVTVFILYFYCNDFTEAEKLPVYFIGLCFSEYSIYLWK